MLVAVGLEIVFHPLHLHHRAMTTPLNINFICQFQVAFFQQLRWRVSCHIYQQAGVQQGDEVLSPNELVALGGRSKGRPCALFKGVFSSSSSDHNATASSIVSTTTLCAFPARSVSTVKGCLHCVDCQMS